MTDDDPTVPAQPGADLGRELSTAVILFHEAIANRLGLTAADNRALGIIAREGPLTAGALAQLTNLTPGAVTGLVDRLARAGYVRRVPDPADRRRVLIEVVPGQPEGQDEAFTALGEAMGRFLARYDEAQLLTIADFCARTIEVLRAQTRQLSALDRARDTTHETTGMASPSNQEAR